MEQQELFAWKPPEPFIAHGQTFITIQDSKRLGEQCQRVHDAFKAHLGIWLTLSQLSDLTGDPEASISARYRQLKTEFGFPMERDRLKEGRGTYIYRMVR